MNKIITTAVATVNADKGDVANVKALRDLAVPKFGKLYARVGKAVASVNAAFPTDPAAAPVPLDGVAVATAIGLKDEIAGFAEVADLIGKPEMKEAVTEATKAIDTLAAMRKGRDYKAFTFPAYVPNEDKAEDAMVELAEITEAVRTAASNIVKHIGDGDFDPNRTKIATALGFKDELMAVKDELLALVTPDTPFTDELAQIVTLDAAYDAIEKSKANGFKTFTALYITEYTA